MLNESGKWNPDAFERAMSRQVGATVSSVYNRSEYWSERIEMMQWWSDWLDAPRWGMDEGQIETEVAAGRLVEVKDDEQG